jgi:hypothetical protein
MNISPWVAFIVPGSWFVFILSAVLGCVLAFLAALAEYLLGPNKFHVPKRYFALIALALWMGVILSVVKRGYWRQEHGFDVGIMGDSGEIRLAGNYYMLLVLDSKMDLGTIIDVTRSHGQDRIYLSAESLGTDWHNIWGILDDAGEKKYFILDARAKDASLFKVMDKKKYEAALKEVGVQNAALLGPKEFYEKKLKEADQPDLFSLKLWFSK